MKHERREFHGRSGDRTLANGNGAPFAKTIVVMAMPGTTSATITHAHVHIVGARTDSAASQTTGNSFASHSRCGTNVTLFLKSGSSDSRTAKETTART